MASRKQWRSFADVRVLVREAGVSSAADYTAWRKSATCPSGVPATPSSVYADEWKGWPDFLGGTRPRGKPPRAWRPYRHARTYIQSLGLASATEYRVWVRTGQRPHDIPASPHNVYQADWTSWGEFLGTGNTFSKTFRPYGEAAAYIQSLGIQTATEYGAWSKTDARPSDIPAAPWRIYRDQWRGFGAFLGTGRRATFQIAYRSYEETRALVRSVGIQTQSQWAEWCESGEKPEDVPASPRHVYPEQWRGWVNFIRQDELGEGESRFLPYDEACRLVQQLGIRTRRELRKWLSEQPMAERRVPWNPGTYYGDEWRGMGHFLGTGRYSPYNKNFLPFDEARVLARKIAHKHGVSRGEHWKRLADARKLPDGLPRTPEHYYADRWRGWQDFLGRVRQWNATALLAFLEDLSGHLEDLRESELLAILMQARVLPSLQKALGQGDPLGAVRRLCEDPARLIEHVRTCSLAANPAERGLSAMEPLPSSIKNADGLEGDTRFSSTQDDAAGELAHLATPRGLATVDLIAGLPGGLDEATAEFLVRNRIAGLWERYMASGSELLAQLNALDGGPYLQAIRTGFLEEVRGTEELVVPEGWAFSPGGEIVAPNAMQRRTAFEVQRRRRIGNWSGVGAGKTVSAVLSSRVIGAKRSLVICNNSTVDGWKETIKSAYPDSVIVETVTDLEGAEPATYCYLVLNYEKFQLADRGSLVDALVRAAVDFVVLDEIQFVKQRERDASMRRLAVETLIERLTATNPDLAILGMSATPVVNNLVEGKKLLQLVTGQGLDHLDTKPTLRNALLLHQALMHHGIRYRRRPDQTLEETVVRVNGYGLADALLEAGTDVLAIEQALLPAKLNALRGEIRTGTMIYSHYVSGMVEEIGAFVRGMGLSVGYFTGEDKSGKDPFARGNLDVLVASAPVGTGVDGLQKVCDQLLVVSLPWTGAEYEQIRGRILRQGGCFANVRVRIPQVVLSHQEQEWSWDQDRWALIQYKRTLADCTVDGYVPEKVRMDPTTLVRQSRQALSAWIERVRVAPALRPAA